MEIMQNSVYVVMAITRMDYQDPVTGDYLLFDDKYVHEPIAIFLTSDDAEVFIMTFDESQYELVTRRDLKIRHIPICKMSAVHVNPVRKKRRSELEKAILAKLASKNQ